MSNHARQVRLLGGVSLIGNILVAAATVFHPLLINPWEDKYAIGAVAHTGTSWLWDHGIMSAGIILWLIGLTGAEALADPSRVKQRTTAKLFIASLAMWLIVLAAELTVIFDTATVAEAGGDPVMDTVASGMLRLGG
jgi:hypothetical protein